MSFPAPRNWIARILFIFLAGFEPSLLGQFYEATASVAGPNRRNRAVQIKTNSPGTFEATFQPILNALSAIMQQLGRGAFANNSTDDLQDMLESLPISTDVFGIASNRIRNARRYLASNEFGAARWELNAMRQQLQSEAIARTSEPRRRLRLRS